MAADKTATLSVRIEPGLKETLRAAAEQEDHSIANMVEVMIRDYCGRNAMGVPAPAALSKSRKPAKSRNS
jgi:hypothetical protein